MAHNKLYMIRAWCDACDLHMIAPWPLERRCWRQFVAQEIVKMWLLSLFSWAWNPALEDMEKCCMDTYTAENQY